MRRRRPRSPMILREEIERKEERATIIAIESDEVLGRQGAFLVLLSLLSDKTKKAAYFGSGVDKEDDGHSNYVS